jgi:hypothetical protein
MQVTIDLPDLLQPQLLAQAEHLQISIETFIIQAIHQQLTQTSSTADALPPPSISPTAQELLSIIGSLNLGTTDLSENHDRYIGEALYQELRNVQ